MRVLMDTTYAERAPYSGTAVYVRELIAALREEGVDVVEAANPSRAEPGGASIVNALADRGWARDELPKRAREAEADVVHHPLPEHSPDVRNVVTIHDVAFEERPDLFDRRYALWARRAHRVAARRGDAVVAVSQTTADAAMRHWGIPREKIVVALHGPGQRLDVQRGEPRHVLYVGDEEPRKNLAMIREAQLPLPLVEARDRDAADLAELYGHALALVHPALIEGFGLPCVEAMAAGVPVVAYPSAAVVEVCGDAIAYARTPAELTAAMDHLPNPETGRERARRYSWRASARAHIEAYTLAAPS
jgi:glycosyltransferase involved in cell wall biosynthesis